MLAYILILLQLFVLTGCSFANQQDPSLPSEAPTASIVPVSSAETTTEPPVAVTPVQSSEVPSDKPLSYDEYFSIIRPYDGSINWDGAYCVDGKTIYRKEEGGNKPIKLYESPDGNISRLLSDGIVLFFLRGTVICRIYLPDGTVDELCDIATKYNNLITYYNVISNHEVWWSELNPEWYRKNAEEAGMSLDDFVKSEKQSFGINRTYNSLTGEYFPKDPDKHMAGLEKK